MAQPQPKQQAFPIQLDQPMQQSLPASDLVVRRRHRLEQDSSDMQQPLPASDLVVVYTDGACLGNPGPGGWAWVIPKGPWASGAESHTTNQRMELTAVLMALQAISGPVKVISDSAYVVNCFRDEWYVLWQKRGWRNANKKPVANRDLWEPLIDLFIARKQEISWHWVKGHSGDEWNEIVDQLATTAAQDQRSR